MSENWIDFTDDDVLAAASPERKSVVAIKRRDDLADICGQVVTQIREAYALSNRDLGADGQIPEGLKARALAIALWRFVSEGVPSNKALQTRQREDAAKEANEFIQKIASVEIGRPASPAMGKRVRRFSHRQEDGV